MTAQNRLPGIRFSRRRFVRDSALAGAAALGFPSIVSARSPNSKLNIAVIGAGGRGADNLAKMAAENVVALCDVKITALAKAAQKFPKPGTYRCLVHWQERDAAVGLRQIRASSGEGVRQLCTAAGDDSTFDRSS